MITFIALSVVTLIIAITWLIITAIREDHAESVGEVNDPTGQAARNARAEAARNQLLRDFGLGL